MRRLSVFVFMLTLIFTLTDQSSAESSPVYRLRTPTANEYFTALPGLVALARSEDKSQYHQDLGAFQQITTDELCANYPNPQSVKFDTLDNAINVDILEPLSDGVCSEHWWYDLILNAWLRENKIDLRTNSQWHFQDYTLNLTPIDFDGDGQVELIGELRVGTGDYPDYQEFMVLKRDETALGKYARVKSPRLWFDGCSIHFFCGGGAQTFKIADVNGDGLSELIVATHSCGYGDCGGSLLVLGWRRGEMVDLAKADWPNDLSWDGTAGGGGGPNLPPDGTWTFEVSNSGEDQIVQRYPFQDNRDCNVTYTTIFTWNKSKDRFIPGNRAIDYADSAPCALRRGQVAFQKSDYFEAAQAYRRAIALLPSSGESYAKEALQYAQIRLILADALSGQTTEALALRSKIQQEIPATATMGTLLDALKVYVDDKDDVQLCAALHLAVANYDPYGNRDTTDLWVFGQTDDVSGRGMYLGGDFSAANTGCDISVLLNSVMDKLPNLPGESPDTELDRLGIKIIQSFSADLNGNGKPVWLFWMQDLPNEALMLIPESKYYRFSLQSIPMPGNNLQLSQVKLPNGSALAGLSFGTFDPWDDDNVEPCGKGLPRGSLFVSQIKKGDLQFIGSYLICKPLTLTQIFASPFQLHAWQIITDGQPAVEVNFHWNATNGTYDLPISKQASSSPPQPPQVDIDCLFEPYCHLDLADLKTLILLNTALSKPPQDASPFFSSAVHYTRALVRQKLGDGSGALADFVTVYESSPSMAWKKLAALHLQLLDGSPVKQ